MKNEVIAYHTQIFYDGKGMYEAKQEKIHLECNFAEHKDFLNRVYFMFCILKILLPTNH